MVIFHCYVSSPEGRKNPPTAPSVKSSSTSKSSNNTSSDLQFQWLQFPLDASPHDGLHIRSRRKWGLGSFTLSMAAWAFGRYHEGTMCTTWLMFIWVCLKIVYPYTQWLMIIIPNCDVGLPSSSFRKLRAPNPPTALPKAQVVAWSAWTRWIYMNRPPPRMQFAASSHRRFVPCMSIIDCWLEMTRTISLMGASPWTRGALAADQAHPFPEVLF